MTSPVFYPAAIVPERVRPWTELNPVSVLIAALRDVVLGRGPVDMRLVLTALVVSSLILVGGHAIFRMTRRHFMDLL